MVMYHPLFLKLLWMLFLLLHVYTLQIYPWMHIMHIIALIFDFYTE